MDLKGRISYIAKHYGLSIRGFEAECGLLRGNISNMTGAIGSDKLAKIIDRFNEVNLYWLLSEIGEPFITKTTKKLNKTNVEEFVEEFVDVPKLLKNSTSLEAEEKTKATENVLKQNEDKLEDKLEDIPKLHKLSSNIEAGVKTKTTEKLVKQDDHLDDHLNDHFPKLQKKWSNNQSPFSDESINDPQTKVGYAIQINNVRGIPLIPHEAFCGFGTTLFDDQKIEEYYYVKEFKHADFLIRIKGSSMYPKYSSGDIIACKLIKEVLYFQWNKIYAVYTESQGIMVKRIRKSTIDEHHIQLCSDNEKYDPFDIPRSDITAVALVIGVIRVE